MLKQPVFTTPRAYSKSELALLYFPYSSPHTAVNHLMSWIARCAPLAEELRRTGYKKTSKMFTPRQVAAIVAQLGEP